MQPRGRLLCVVVLLEVQLARPVGRREEPELRLRGLGASAYRLTLVLGSSYGLVPDMGCSGSAELRSGLEEGNGRLIRRAIARLEGRR